jgi:hypothetical protein
VERKDKITGFEPRNGEPWAAAVGLIEGNRAYALVLYQVIVPYHISASMEVILVLQRQGHQYGTRGMQIEES